MMRPKSIPLGFLFGLSLGLGAVGLTQLQSNAFGPPIQSRTLESGAHSRIERSTTEVIRTENQWRTYWARHTGQPPQNAPRRVDWTKDQIVAIHLGRRDSGGYEVFVKKIERVNPGQVKITYVEKAPSPGAPVTKMLTQPFTIVQMSRVAGNITFAKETELNRWPGGGGAPPLCNCTCDCCRSGRCIPADSGPGRWPKPPGSR